jgi:hypothetical protein
LGVRLDAKRGCSYEFRHQGERERQALPYRILLAGLAWNFSGPRQEKKT